MILGSGRVLIVGPQPPPVGGDTVLTANLLSSRYWKEAGFETEGLNTSSGGGVRLPGDGRTPADAARAARILGGLVRKIGGCRVVLLLVNSSFLCTLGVPVMSICRLRGRPYIVKPFGTFLPDRLRSLGRRRRDSVVRGLAASWRVLPETLLMRDELVSITGLDESRFAHLPNFIPDRYLERHLERRAFSGKLVFAGQIKSEKGVFEIIEALAEMPRMRCDFFGPLYQGDREAFLDRIASSGNCDYGGLVESGRVMEKMSEYDVLLLPSRHPGEGYPAVVLEAFAAGLPVIATRWRSLPELIEDGRTGLLVPPGSPAGIIEALRSLESGKDLYMEMAANARRRAEDFCERKVIGDILIGLVRGAAGEEV